ncbi:hypothetical protein PI126_g15179 [Phytophthora idaei]|nr:hypothetical protein PI126_g15179 [Phytophthora idaei]
MSTILARVEVALEAALNGLPDAAIRYPTKEIQLEWVATVRAREPLVEGVCGFVDGKNYRVQEPSDIDLQNAHYNGWLHSVLVTGTHCYGCGAFPSEAPATVPLVLCGADKTLGDSVVQ